MSESRKILVVDDDRDLRIGLNARLRASGYQTVFAEDGATAVSTAVKEIPDLILLDIGLPAGDGFVVLERLKQNSKLSHVPVIVLTAGNPAALEGRALDAGAFAFHRKPVASDVLLQSISEALP